MIGSTLPLLPLSMMRTAHAADLPPLPSDNATAKALNYVETTDGLAHAAFKPGSNCANCSFIQAADSAGRYPCTLFPGFSVAAEGWCSAWALKAG
jgi:hypothetical protein